MAACDVAKVAENELEFLTGEKDIFRGAELLRRQYPNLRLLTVTAGENGSYAFFENHAVYAPACLQERTVDTTGAGDCFFGCVLHHVLHHGLEAWSKIDLEEMLRFANAAAGLLVMRKGAMTAMPGFVEIRQMIDNG